MLRLNNRDAEKLQEGTESMKMEKYLLWVLVLFVLIVLGSYVQKIVH
jgi:hypothetical protein